MDTGRGIDKTGSIEAVDALKSTRSEADLKLLRGAGFKGVVADRAHVERIRQEMIRRAGRGLVTAGPSGRHPSLNRGAMVVKRTMDTIGAGLGIVVFLPFWLLIALAIKLTSTGPVLFSQHRLGEHGRWFPSLKFRTMVLDADERLNQLLKEDSVAREEFNAFHKLKNDPRVTSVGSFLRRTSLDEIPQLLNVFVGHMSLVGPRAYLPWEVLKMPDTDRILKIVSVRPGLTGFWQVGGRNNIEFDERLDMDVFYIENWSVGMDLYLLVNTVWILLFGRGTGAS